MKKKFDRNRVKTGIKKSQDISYRTKDSKGVSGVYSYNLEATGLPTYKPISDTTKKNRVAFLPFFPGSKDPVQGKHPESEREYTHILDFWDHNVPDVGRFICLLNTYGQKCPICEWLKTSRTGDQEEDKKTWLKYKATRRGVYAVWDLADKSAGPKIWYTPFKWIEEKVQGLTKDPETGETIYYTDLDEGQNVYFTFEDKGNYNHEYRDFQFKPRRDPIPDEILEAIPSLDEFLIVPSYDDIRTAFDPHGTAIIEEELDGISEERKPKLVRDKKKDKCPEGGKFGKDFNELDECEDCSLYDECGEKYAELNEPEEEEPEEESEKEDDPPFDDDDKEEPKKPERKPLRRRG